MSATGMPANVRSMILEYIHGICGKTAMRFCFDSRYAIQNAISYWQDGYYYAFT